MPASFFLHAPVLLSEVMDNLMHNPSGIYIDGTFGRGGHSQALLKKLDKNARLFVVDQDPEAIAVARTFKDKRVKILNGSFTFLKNWLQTEGLIGKIDGILLDLGLSSPQLDNAYRGFSFSKEGPLDMRMNPTQGLSLAKILPRLTQEKLAHVIKTYGEEKFARRIGRAIFDAHRKNPLKTTLDLANVIAAAHPAWPKHTHPATRTFQALRIYVNQELDALKSVLPQCLDVLKIRGRLAVISFHSLEDRLVKRFIQNAFRPCLIPFGKNLIPPQEALPRFRKLTPLIRPSRTECLQNPRARSARLRIAEKIQ